MCTVKRDNDYHYNSNTRNSIRRCYISLMFWFLKGPERLVFISPVLSVTRAYQLIDTLAVCRVHFCVPQKSTC